MIKQCYLKLGGDYDEALGRLMNDSLIEKFIIKFLDDKSMEMLVAAVKEGNIEESFKAAHMLKGVSANLAFSELRDSISELTEQLRDLDKEADKEIYDKVVVSYNKTISAIKEFVANKE